jgi:hypothetical protein
MRRIAKKGKGGQSGAVNAPLATELPFHNVSMPVFFAHLFQFAPLCRKKPKCVLTSGSGMLRWQQASRKIDYIATVSFLLSISPAELSHNAE